MHRSRKLNIYLISLFSVFFCSMNVTFGQKSILSETTAFIDKSGFRQDTALEIRKRNALMSEPDTNFTWEKYADFLIKISDTSKYIVLPLGEFRKTFNTNKIVIGLRHDIDNDLTIGYAFSDIEYKLGFRSSYYILHTAPYYLKNGNDMAVHSESIIPILKTMQDDRHFEIGWHNDLVTLQLIYNINPVTFFTNELAWLRSNGIKINGTAAHGSNYCKVYHYMNFYFFEECTYPVVPLREFNITVPIGGKMVPIIKGKLSDFNLEYEAYFLNNNKAFSDATITNGIRWDIGMLDLQQLHPGDRAIILLHPIHWHKGSVKADVVSFNIAGQKSSAIDPVKSIVSVVMPYGTDLNSLKPWYSLSPGAYAKVSGKLQVNGGSINSFKNPVVYTVFAENRAVKKEWTINVQNAKNSSCDFKAFVFPGLTKSVYINTIQKTILVKVKESVDLTRLVPKFELSYGATAWIGPDLQLRDTGIIDFSSTLFYKVIAEDGVTSCQWSVTVRNEQNQSNFLSFFIKGMIGSARIDTLDATIEAEISSEVQIFALKPVFSLSENARAYIGKKEQFSDQDYNNFTDPVYYDVVSKDSLKIKRWKVSLVQIIVSIEALNADKGILTIYPNPSEGIFNLQFYKIKNYTTTIDVFNSLGKKVYSEVITGTGDFTRESNLSWLPAGIYILRYSGSEKAARFIIQK